MNKEEFIAKAKKIHGNRYDYTKVDYVDSKTKVCIICKEHGEFWQTPSNHFRGHGCPKCGITQPLNTQAFIERAKKTHGDRYDYSEVNYKNMYTKVAIICLNHGLFYQLPFNHLNGQGCPACKAEDVGNRKRMSVEEFIKRAVAVHKEKYDYSKVNYRNNHTKVCIICPKHGEFWQNPESHLNGCGCPMCGLRGLKRG